VPLVSAGSSTNPAFGTAVVAGGGTGLTSATAYAVVCGGTSSTGNLQSIASLGTSGQVLTSNGASALPTFQAAAGGGPFTTVTGQLTSAQIKTLHGSPVTIIAAPGAGKAILILSSFSSFVYGGTSAFTGTGAQSISMYYGTSSSIGTIVSIAQLTQSTSFVDYNTAFTLTSSSTSVINNIAVNLYNPGSPEVGGNAANDNVVNYTIVYQVVSI
jgi:hypothetical protein